MSESDRTIQPGDIISVSLGGESSYYIIRYVSPEEVYFSPEDDPENLSKLVVTDQGWRVFGAEDVPYEFSFTLAEAVPEPPIVEIIPEPITGLPMTPTTQEPVQPYQRTPMVRPVISPVRPVSPKAVSPVRPVSPKAVSPVRPASPKPVSPPKPVIRPAMAKVSRLLTGAPTPVVPGEPEPEPVVKPVQRVERPVKSRLLTGAPLPEVVSEEAQPEPISMIEVNDDLAAEVCVEVVTGKKRQLSSVELTQLQRFAQNNQLEEVGSTYPKQRVACEGILKRIINRKFPQVNTERISGQNLAREYQVSQARYLEEQARLEVQRQEEERLAQAQALKERVENARRDIFEEDLARLRRDGLAEDKCLGQQRLNGVVLIPQINPELLGRRVNLPQQEWRKIFEPIALSQEPLVQDALQELGYESEDLSDSQIKDILGLDLVMSLVGYRVDQPELSPNSQVFIRMTTQTIESPVYALVAGFHQEDEDRLEVSEGLYRELGQITDYVKINECGLKPVSSIGLELRRFPERAAVSEDDVKEKLINMIEELGALTVGDLLPAYPGLVYQIINLKTNPEELVYAAGLPPTSGEVTLHLVSEKHQDLLQRIEVKLGESIDPVLV